MRVFPVEGHSLSWASDPARFRGKARSPGTAQRWNGGLGRVLPGGQHPPWLAPRGGGADRTATGLPVAGRSRGHWAPGGYWAPGSMQPGRGQGCCDGGMARLSVRGTRGSGRGWRQPVLRVRSPVLSAQGPQPGDRAPAIGSVLVYLCDEQQASCSGGTRT